MILNAILVAFLTLFLAVFIALNVGVAFVYGRPLSKTGRRVFFLAVFMKWVAKVIDNICFNEDDK